MAPPRRSRAKSKPKSDVEQLAALYAKARATLDHAGSALHDHVGSSLSAVGVQLQLLRMDVPLAQARIDETLQILDETLNHVRHLSEDLTTSASRGGLKQALLRLADRYELKNHKVVAQYSATAVFPLEVASALYEACSAVVEQAFHRGALHVNIAVQGSRRLVLRITDDGRRSGRTRALAAVGAVARAQGLAFEVTTEQGTIVSYAVRRPAGG
jgi:nitrate/nitrite-specific signal transduction histidine kinase